MNRRKETLTKRVLLAGRKSRVTGQGYETCEEEEKTLVKRERDFTILADNGLAILTVCILFVLAWMVAGLW